MSSKDWLSLTEIAQLWSEETGESAEDLERDLNTWFSEFVAHASSQQSGGRSDGSDTTNLLMGMLGGRHLQRENFAVYCEEKGYAKPRFWFGGDAEEREPDPPFPSDSSFVAKLQALHGFASEAKSEQRRVEETWSNPTENRGDLAPPSPEIGNNTPGPIFDQPTPSESVAGHKLENITKGPQAPVTLWQAESELSSGLIVRFLARVRALRRSNGIHANRKATRLAGGVVLGLSLLVIGIVFGQGESGSSQSGPSVAGQEEIPTTLVHSLRSELDDARQTISRLKEEAAVGTAGAEAAHRDLVLAAQTASVHAALLHQDLAVAKKRIADLEANASAAGVKAANLARQLAEARKAHTEALEKLRSESEERANSLGMPLASTPSGGAKVTNASVSPRIAEVHTAVARVDPTAAAETVDLDNLVTSPERYEARRIVVTGSLFRLLHQYRLESRMGRKSLVVDVTKLHRAQHDMLQDAVARTGVISSMRAQISGKVVRGPTGAYRLAASHLILLE